MMCKHVAAAMYGIEIRFDENPFFFFNLRGIDIDRLIDTALENRVETMLAHADCQSSRILFKTQTSRICSECCEGDRQLVPHSSQSIIN